MKALAAGEGAKFHGAWSASCHKRPQPLHHAALVWSNRNEVWAGPLELGNPPAALRVALDRIRSAHAFHADPQAKR